MPFDFCCKGLRISEMDTGWVIFGGMRLRKRALRFLVH